MTNQPGDIMWQGRVEAIYIAPAAKAPVERVPDVHAVAGRGLAGDRYFHDGGTFSHLGRGGRNGRDVTLICIEEIEAMARDYQIAIDPADARRNIVTRGVPLNHLVGKTFQMGDVVLRGVRLCEPCTHLATVTGIDLIGGMVHRGGLRCDIVQSGIIRANDSVREVVSTDSVVA